MTTETIERPRTSDPGTGGGGWRVIVRNDDHNTFEHVAATLARVIPGLSYDNGMAFADLPKIRSGPTRRLGAHVFDRVCREHGIEHRLTKPCHSWPDGQAETMNRAVKEATIKVFHHPASRR